MSCPKLNPLEIPEIVSRVGDFLKRKELLHCIRVSKTFHNALAKFIWKRISIGRDNSRYFTAEGLQNYKEYIEGLVFFDHFPREFKSLQGCGRLKSIGYYAESSQDPRAPSHLSKLVKAHSFTITEFRFNCPSLQGIWSALLECTHLKVLNIFGLTILDDEVDLFFQVCKRVMYLTVTRVNINQLPSNFMDDNTDKFFFPKMSMLHLHDVQISNLSHPHTSSYCFGMLTRRCPGLRYLGFIEKNDDTQSLRQISMDFYRAAFHHRPFTLANLSELCFSRMEISDEDMAALLRQMTELRRLEVRWCEFGPLSLRELLADEQEVSEDGRIVRKRRNQRLCDTVEILEINDESERADGIVQAILSNCPRLKRLRGPRMTVTEIVDGAEWVSTRLSLIAVSLVVDVDQKTAEGKEKGRLAYGQIRKLTRLDPSNFSSYRKQLSFADLTPEKNQS
ncbi:hypothetical protein BCR41DRAFT_358699 [Lobosporangium transversale]|uniref:F-box domain-containing protein n=1 Tax=Lobosporangium transversale TaxID=64571 RepID=A0A1Y2GHT3_9FUNG|nr:hypothetical protein BCR41DRAFT_358699 [Lobosporangium transversale]ORZ09436.1 hypothetical protein BCR41DRAFT_358699 [Lobosporangium transversale]|eukprot:XP_021878889.1 hypothetical protein BCR41DRAFT_358699 [Lobosporangium transversale]